MPHRTSSPLGRPLLLAAAVLLAAPAAAELPGDGVRLLLGGPATPYAAVRYEVSYRRGTVVAEVDKRFADGFGHRGEVGLLAKGDLEALMDEVEALGGFTLRGHSHADPRTVWQVETRRGAKRHRFVVHDPERLADARYRSLIDRVRTRVRLTVGAVPYRDRLLLDGEYGRLRLRARPRATLAVDGVPWPGTTPMNDVRLPAGTHTLALTPVEGGEAHTYEVQIVVGKTTSLNVELK